MTTAEHNEINGANDLPNAQGVGGSNATTTTSEDASAQFISSLSYDIRTPLNTIIGMTAIAQSHLDDPERVKDSLDKINTSSRHLLGIINDVLDLDSIKQGKVSLEETPFNFTSLIENMIAMVRPQIDERLHDFNVEISGIEHDNVIGDSLRIQQVFTNVMSNAVKYTPVGGTITLTVQEKSIQRAGYGCYAFSVKDTGIGMDESFVKHAFEPFSRALREDGSDVHGAGLGLAISKNIVDMMGGTIAVDSKLGEGTCVSFDLLLKLQESADSEGAFDATLSDASGDYAAIGSYAGKRFLIVDDNKIDQEIAVELMSETGATTEVAENGKVAVDKIREADAGYYDIVFMDIQMPIMNGYEATMAIRALPEGKGENLPIIALTAHAFAEDVDMAKSAGVSEHVSKPIDFNRLMKVIRTWVK